MRAKCELAIVRRVEDSRSLEGPWRLELPNWSLVLDFYFTKFTFTFHLKKKKKKKGEKKINGSGG
jgi:hypothetical protein